MEVPFLSGSGEGRGAGNGKDVDGIFIGHLVCDLAMVTLEEERDICISELVRVHTTQRQKIRLKNPPARLTCCSLDMSIALLCKCKIVVLDGEL